MARQIRQDEIHLIQHLLLLAKCKITIPSIVTDLEDGGMGSISFANSNSRIFGKELIQVKYFDQDNIEVLISLDLDDQNELFELDFWKVDFNRLIRYPKPNEVNAD